MLLAIAAVILGEWARPRIVSRIPLRDLLAGAGQVAGWRSDFRPLAETPEGARAVADILAYDDAAFVEFSNGVTRISAYVAYWQPGKTSPRAVARHTPDRCWILSGWECSRRATNRGIATRSGKPVMPAEERTMHLSGHSENVLFWHLVGGRAVSYPSEVPPWHAVVTDLWRMGLQLRQEQFFIRLSSPAPVDQWVASEPVRALLARLPLVAE